MVKETGHIYRAIFFSFLPLCLEVAFVGFLVFFWLVGVFGFFWWWFFSLLGFDLLGFVVCVCVCVCYVY